MTLRAGTVASGTINAFAESSETRINLGHAGDVSFLGIALGGTPPIYKNYGYNSGVQESWITIGLVGTNFNPNTGHTLTNVDYIRLQ